VSDISYEIQSAPTEIKIVEGANVIKEKKEKYWDSIKKDIELPGFRKGHVDRKTYENKVGYFNLYHPIVDDVVFSALESIKDFRIVCVLEKKVVQFFDDIPLIVKVLVDTRPNVKITGNYKNIEIEVPKIKVIDEEVDRRINSLVYSKTPAKPITDRPTQKGDSIKIDYKGFIVEDNAWRPLAGYEAKNVNLVLGNNRLSIIPDIEESIVGMKKDEIKTIEGTIQEKRGKVEVCLKEISIRELPEINDELAKQYKFTSLEDMKSKTRDELAQFKKAQIEVDKQGKIIDALIKDCEFDSIPKSMVRMQIESALQSECKNFGMDVKKFLETMKITRAAYEEDRFEDALRLVKARLALEELAEREKIGCTDEEIEKEMGENAKKAGVKLEEYKNRVNKDGIGNDLKVGKALLYLKESVRYKEV
jgi:trigger factor